jgi:hypothetical protein
MPPKVEGRVWLQVVSWNGQGDDGLVPECGKKLLQENYERMKLHCP